jgi:phenylalanine-4-hydroxylase
LCFFEGLLSSFGELQHALSTKPEVKPFEPEITVIQEYQGWKRKSNFLFK